ncbi:transcriptional regulator, BadM/Rrf2 family [Frankia torreyi]|uniref:Transcriptional regulator, BadM/Rrf2 family n=1 Tax=Frankia torreyi TaxID=1856 RepID=A0A0D8BG95_9ACTN|nr:MULTISPECIES: Rrf2 family transcriptional regulator [Frankia]KJE22452.1 transcriptional regulator, BadM/Rrf2 family [Frankia torreyi]KQM04490.1 transcriptional regulator, BadM/Rrf2 family [Frankia sp. CpI1-P]
MRITQGVEWALHCCHALAEAPGGVALTVQQLAELHAGNPAYLAKHLQALSRAGIVLSVLGPRGGYRLGRPPDQIRLLDVVEAIEGQGPVFLCTEIRQRGPAALAPASYRMPCAIAAAVGAAEQAWRRELASTTVADIVAESRRRAPEAIAATARWLEQSAQNRGRRSSGGDAGATGP